MPMHDMLKKNKYTNNIKAKRIKILLNMIASMFLGDVGVIRCTSKADSPYQTVMIVCEFKLIFSYLKSS